MTTHPLVSIITPSYNQAEFIEETILSVIHQEYPNKEYLVVDGGSTDGSIEIIQKYDRQLTWSVSEPDQGQADAINKGFQQSRGEIVAWLNSDDYYLPRAIENAVYFFKQHPQAVLIYGDVITIDAQGGFIRHLHYRQMELLDLMCFNIIGQPAVFIRRDSLNKSGLLDLTYKFLLDHHLWLRLATLGPIFHVNKTLATARFHSESKNVAQAGEFGKEAFRIVEWMRADPAFKDLFHANQSRIVSAAERVNARYLLDGGESRQAFQAYLKSLRLHPATALKEWYRIIFALLTGWGFGFLRRFIPKWRE